MHIVLFFAAASALAYPPDKEPHPFAPSVQAIYEQAFTQMEAGDFAGALPLAERVTNEAPQNPRAWRLLGQLYFNTQHADEAERALGRAIELGIDNKRKADVLGLRAMLRMQAHRPEEATGNAEAALRLDPKEPSSLWVMAIERLERGRLAEGRSYLEQLIAVQPGLADAHALYATLLADQDEIDRAEEELRTAHALGASPKLTVETDAILGAKRRDRLLWQAPLLAALAIALALGLFFVAGSLLSRVEIARLSAVDVRLLRNEQTLGDRLVELCYGLVLWLGTFLFYASLPVMLVLTLAVGALLLWLLFQLPRIPVQAIVIAVVAAFGGVWAIIRGLFLSRGNVQRGRTLEEREAPALFTALREVAQVARAKMVNRVQLDPDANVGVREDGGTLRVLFGGGERVLHLGYAALRNLTVTELKAILAHEYGHFSHGETRLNPVIGRIIGSSLSIIQRMNTLGWSAAVNPVYWYLRLYFKVYLRVTMGQSRRRELLADRAAALAYGGDTFASALEQVVENGELFDRAGYELAGRLRETGRPCHDVYRYLDAAQEVAPDSLRERRVNEILDRTPSMYDSHPPPRDRFARVAAIPASRPPESALARSLFVDPNAIARELSATVVDRIDAHLLDRGIRKAPPVEAAVEREERLAAAISLHMDALDVAEKDAAAGDALLMAALDEMEAAAGPTDPALVRALASASRVRSQRGDLPGAAAALERAIHIVETTKDETRADELRAMLADVKAAA
jgi:Zn-dependent protease with chaperone function/Tfp pilus assembly protein PilF